MYLLFKLIDTIFSKVKKILQIPLGIKQEGNTLEDIYSGEKLKLNDTGIYILESLKLKSINDTVKDISISCKIDEDLVRDDVNTLVNELTRKKFITWSFIGKNKLLVLFFNEIYKLSSNYFKRYSPGNKPGYKTILSIANMICSRLFIFMTLTFISALFLDIIAEFNISIFLYSIMIYLGIIASTILHEFLHCYFHFKTTNKMGYFQVERFKFSYIRNYNNNILTTKFLPAFITVMVGFLGCGLKYLFPDSTIISLLTAMFLMFLTHIIELLPVKGDGEAILNSIIKWRGKV